MVFIRVGCAGWDYKDWISSFYPKKLKKYEHLEYYAKFFDFTEINSTFYNLPSEETVSKWLNRVPENFCFAVKVWQKITHDMNAHDIESRISQFFYRMKPLERKVKAYLLQFPPWFKYSNKHIKNIMSLINILPKDFTFFLEFRDNSWFDPIILSEFVDSSRILLGTSYKERINTYYFPNQEKYYIRLIGDRQLVIFDRVQREQEASIEEINHKIQMLCEKPEMLEIFIIVNNHFTGFAPETANLIKRNLGLNFRRLKKQKSILDYLGE